MSLTRLLTFNTFAQYLGKAIGLLASVIITSLLTRKLGVEGYGQYIYIFSLVMLLFSLTDWGSTFIATREAANTPEKSTSIFSTNLLLRLLFTFSIALLLVATTFLYPPLVRLQPVALAGALLLPLLSLKTSLQVVFQTQFQLWRLSLIDVFGSLSFLALVILLPSNSLSPSNTLLLLGLASLLSLLLGVPLALNLIKPSLSFNPTIAKQLIRESLSMGLLLTIFSIYNRLDIFILERFQGPSAVAFYGLSYKIYENLVIGAALFANVTFPLLSQAQPKGQFRQLLHRNLVLLFLLGLLATLLALGLSRPLILLLGGQSFSSSILSLRLLAPAILIAYLNHAIGYSLVALKKQAYAAATALIALLVNAGLNFLLVPHYSFYASALITGLTEATVLLLNTLLLVRALGPLNFRMLAANLHPKTIISLLRE